MSDSQQAGSGISPTSVGKFEAPSPGSQKMPRWTAGELIEPPVFTKRNWFALLGPGLIMGGAAIGGGEWLLGHHTCCGCDRAFFTRLHTYIHSGM